tara:strand:+ start:2197 stop:2625 length:429 start_codon:yes stop_codon:yes gene_type:complete
MSSRNNITYKSIFEDEWIDKIIELHNKTEMKRSAEQRAELLESFKRRNIVISAWNNKNLVGIGTSLSDGFLYSVIFDVVVDPDYQKRGIGKTIIELIMKENPSKSYLLTSTFGNEDFYKKLGFKKHKTAFAKLPTSSQYLEE